MANRSFKRGPQFRGIPDIATLREFLRYIDSTPAVTWTGTGGVKERALELISEHDTEAAESASEQHREE